jgi:S-(hydroxymethyl)glutathione dehydrogenase / alcohol dehydrogenase
MRAAVLRNTGDTELDVTDGIEANPPAAGEVTIKIEATGVCHSDLSAMSGIIPQPAPAVLGHEGAGIISAVGDGVTGVKEGDHVIVAWSPPCGHCVNCTTRHSPHLCGEMMGAAYAPRFSENGTPVFGMAGSGTFAEYMTIPQEGAIKIADDIPFEIASLIGCGVTTGVGAAINTAKVTPGSSVVVFGCGGVGISAIQGAKVAGAAEIVAVDLVDHKLEDAKRFGATHAVKPDQLAELQAELTGDGFDYSFEAIGNPITIRAAYDAVRRGGTACIVGVGGMDQNVSFNSFEIFYSEKNFKGSFYGSADVRSDFHRLLKLWKSGQLDLEGMISKVIKIDDINDAFAQMKAGEVIRSVITF